MGEFQMLVDPGLRVLRQRVDVHLARREHHLRVLALDPVAIDIDVGEIVVEADFLQLIVGIEERARVPQPDVLDRRRICWIAAGVSVPFPANGFTSTVSSLYACRVISILR